MRKDKKGLRRPPEPKADPWVAPDQGEEIPLIEAQDPAVLDQQEGPDRPPDPPAPRPPEPDPGPAS